VLTLRQFPDQLLPVNNVVTIVFTCAGQAYQMSRHL